MYLLMRELIIVDARRHSSGAVVRRLAYKSCPLPSQDLPLSSNILGNNNRSFLAATVHRQ